MSTEEKPKIKVFRKFLRYQRCSKKFFRNFKTYQWDETGQKRDINHFLNRNSAMYYISAGFDWTKTPEGMHYWMELNALWRSYYLKKKNHETA
jgi:hypothetical protein